MQPADAGLPLSRRSLLSLGLGGAALLATGGVLTACSGTRPAPLAGLKILTPADAALFAALMPVVLSPAALPQAAAARDAAQAEVLARIDGALRLLHPFVQADVRRLLDLLHLRPARWLTTGIGASWAEASTAQLTTFLTRWRDSRLVLFRTGYGLLTKLIAGSFYASSASHAVSEYPGPPDWALTLVNS